MLIIDKDPITSKIQIGLHPMVVGFTVIGPQEKINIILSVYSPILTGLYLLLD